MVILMMALKATWRRGQRSSISMHLWRWIPRTSPSLPLTWNFLGKLHEREIHIYSFESWYVWVYCGCRLVYRNYIKSASPTPQYCPCFIFHISWTGLSVPHSCHAPFCQWLFAHTIKFSINTFWLNPVHHSDLISSGITISWKPFRNSSPLLSALLSMYFSFRDLSDCNFIVFHTYLIILCPFARV